MYLISSNRKLSLLNKENNNLDIVRLFAATMVIVGHAFTLHPTGGYEDPMFLISGFSYLGSTAVSIFFFVSGILVTQSFIKRNDPFEYTLMRVFRIWPAFIVCILFTAFVLGPLYTKLTYFDYFTSVGLRKYVLGNISMFRMEYGIPGESYLTDVHWPYAINISIWTLPLEVACYLMILIVGFFGGLNNKKSALFSLSLVLIGLYLYNGQEKVFSDINVSFFMIGAIASILGDKIGISLKYLAALLATYALLRESAIGEVLFYASVFYSVLVLSNMKLLKSFRFSGDYSYGTYLYGFIVQQLIAFYLPEVTTYQSLIIAVPASIFLGFLSWHTVEKRALHKAREMVDLRRSRLDQA